MTLMTGLTSERKLAGAVVLSGFLPLHKKFKSVRFVPSPLMYYLANIPPL